MFLALGRVSMSFLAKASGSGEAKLSISSGKTSMTPPTFYE
jgi:hypothetical protein